MSSQKRRQASPRLEALEARDVPAIIGGIVYHDANANGLFDSGEAGLPGSTLQLRDEAGGLIASTTSGADGRYQFTKRDNVAPGSGLTSYEAIFSDSPTDLTRSATVSQFDPTLGTLLSVDIIAEGSITSQTVMENLGRHLASVKTEYNASLAYQVQGLTSSLRSDISRELAGTLEAFDGVADLQGASARDFGPVRMNGQFTTQTISDPAQLAAFIGAGSLQVSQQASATSTSSGPGNLMSMVKTSAQGKVKVVYRYTPSNEIGPGKYVIVQTPQPNGYLDGRETKDNVTSITGSDKTDRIEVGVAGRNDQLLSNHFGEVKAASLSGTVYHDVNKNGTMEATEPRLAGVRMTLSGTDAFGNAVTRATVTNALGRYEFLSLLPGSYVITETQPAGYSQGTNVAGSLGGTVVEDTISVDVKSGDVGVGYDFGEIRDTVIPPPPLTNPPSYPPGTFGKFRFFDFLV
jgi:hypothetical protein